MQSHYYIICNSYFVTLVLYQLTQNVLNSITQSVKEPSISGYFFLEFSFVLYFLENKSQQQKLHNKKKNIKCKSHWIKESHFWDKYT